MILQQSVSAHQSRLVCGTRTFRVPAAFVSFSTRRRSVPSSRLARVQQALVPRSRLLGRRLFDQSSTSRPPTSRSTFKTLRFSASYSYATLKTSLRRLPSPGRAHPAATARRPSYTVGSRLVDRHRPLNLQNHPPTTYPPSSRAPSGRLPAHSPFAPLVRRARFILGCLLNDYPACCLV